MKLEPIVLDQFPDDKKLAQKKVKNTDYNLNEKTHILKNLLTLLHPCQLCHQNLVIADKIQKC